MPNKVCSFNNADSWKLFIAEKQFGVEFSSLEKAFPSAGLLWYNSTWDFYVRLIHTAQRRYTEHCRIKGGGFAYENPSFHLLMLYPFAHLCTFIYAPWTKINWQMCIYKSLVVYSPESSQQHILVITYYLWLYLVPVETEGKILRHLIKSVSLVLM